MNKIEELKKIKKMFDDGLLSEEEYSLLKSEIITYSLNSIPNIDKNQVNKKEADSQSENNIKQEKIIATEEFPVAKPHFSKMGVILFTAIIAVLVLVYQLHDNGLINFKNQSEISDDNIKNLTDLETYINREADNYCQIWHKAIAFNNEQKKHEEWVRLDGMILNFETQIIPLLVKNNDLPDDYVRKGADFFNKRLDSCGYYYYGGSPPENKIIESNKTDEFQNNESVFNDKEIDSLSDENSESNEVNNEISLGGYYHGGIIFYLDYDEKHGLVRTNTIENKNGFTWDMAQQSSEEYSNDGFDNWYLPESKDLEMIFADKKDNALKDGKYWTGYTGLKNGNFMGYSSSDNSFWVTYSDYRVPMAIFISKF